MKYLLLYSKLEKTLSNHPQCKTKGNSNKTSLLKAFIGVFTRGGKGGSKVKYKVAEVRLTSSQKFGFWSSLWNHCHE